MFSEETHLQQKVVIARWKRQESLDIMLNKLALYDRTLQEILNQKKQNENKLPRFHDVTYGLPLMDVGGAVLAKVGEYHFKINYLTIGSIRYVLAFPYASPLVSLWAGFHKNYREGSNPFIGMFMQPTYGFHFLTGSGYNLPANMLQCCTGDLDFTMTPLQCSSITTFQGYATQMVQSLKTINCNSIGNHAGIDPQTDYLLETIYDQDTFWQGRIARLKRVGLLIKQEDILA